LSPKTGNLELLDREEPFLVMPYHVNLGYPLEIKVGPRGCLGVWGSFWKDKAETILVETADELVEVLENFHDTIAEIPVFRPLLDGSTDILGYLKDCARQRSILAAATSPDELKVGDTFGIKILADTAWAYAHTALGKYQWRVYGRNANMAAITHYLNDRNLPIVHLAKEVSNQSAIKSWVCESSESVMQIFMEANSNKFQIVQIIGNMVIRVTYSDGGPSANNNILIMAYDGDDPEVLFLEPLTHHTIDADLKKVIEALHHHDVRFMLKDRDGKLELVKDILYEPENLRHLDVLL
ncbi:MAG: hypothetical protein D6698_09015, partial [Gammaproteobacteria bacterium]